MAELKYKDINKYYWCAWGGDVVHFGQLENNQVITTGLANLENYATEKELEAKVDSLKTSGYYQQNKIQ